MTKHLGRLPNDPTKARLTLLPTATIAPPTSADYLTGVKSWPMSLNDSIGDCTAAGAAHIAQLVNWFGQHKDAPVSDADVLKMYSAISGYDPKTGRNDNGATLQDALGYWRKSGLGGNKIAAFAEIDATNLDLVRNSIAIFGSVYAGMNFPTTGMAQFDSGKPWTVVAKAKIDGGHCVPLGAYDQTSFSCVSWGRVQKMDLRFYSTYFDECWVPIDLDWLQVSGISPAGLDVATLNADYASLIGKPGPFQSVTPTPVPVPTPQPAPAPSSDSTLLKGLRVDINAISAKLKAGGY